MNLIDKHIKATATFVANKFEMSFETMTLPYRDSPIVFPRQIAMYLCARYISGAQLSRIGSVIGNKDHSTVSHAKRTIAALIKPNHNGKVYGKGKKVLEVEKQFIEELLPIIRKYNISLDKDFKTLQQDYDVTTQFYNESVELMYICSLDTINSIWKMVKDDNVMEGWRKARLKKQVDDAKVRLKKQREKVLY